MAKIGDKIIGSAKAEPKKKPAPKKQVKEKK